MRELLQSHISEEVFNACWETTPPSFHGFLDAAAERLSVHACEGDAVGFRAAIRPWGRNRIRVDGEFRTRDGNSRTYYIEVVWLPASNSYRGQARVYNTPPEIEPKSVDQFIAALDSIIEEETMILAGQAFQAASGVDLKAKDLSCAYPAIFRLFERFQDEYFDSPEALMSLLVDGGGYEKELIKSLQRAPSLPGVTLVSYLMQAATSANERQRWLSILREVGDSTSAPTSVKELAFELKR